MDNITLFTNNKSDLQNMINTTEEFYKINNISINLKKSNLLIINRRSKDKEEEITLQNNTLQGTDSRTLIRILGIWHLSKGNKQYQKELIKQKIDQTSNILR